MNRRLSLWLSPWEPYQSADELVAACRGVNLPGHQTEILIPTLYDDWPQQVLSRTLGDALAIDSIDDAATVRALIEADGISCGGWSVPRGTGEIYGEGYKHGQVAALFDHFVLNYEDGWSGFWTDDGRWAVDEFMRGFQDGLGGARPRLGVTFVTNTAMLQAVSPDEAAAWLEHADYVAIEVYVPGDPGLDPDLGAARMRDELAAAGHPDVPIVCILERGDLSTLAAAESHPELGVQVWTIGAALQHTWPDIAPPPPPDVDFGWLAKKDLVVGLAGELQNVADQFGIEAGRKSGPRKSMVLALAAGVRSRAEQILS